MSTFTQVVVWPGTLMGQNTPAEFEAFIYDEFSGTRAKCIGEVTTKPDWDDPETGAVRTCSSMWHPKILESLLWLAWHTECGGLKMC